MPLQSVSILHTHDEKWTWTVRQCARSQPLFPEPESCENVLMIRITSALTGKHIEEVPSPWTEALINRHYRVDWNP